MAKTKSFKAVTMIALVIIALSLTTCQTLQAFLPEPVISLHSVELTKINFTGIELTCKINVENRTVLDIPIPDFDWELFLNQNSFVKGEINSGGRMRSRQTNIVEIPVSLTYLDIFNTFNSLKGNKTTDYGIAIGVKLDIPYIGEKVWNFKHEGTLPVLQVPKFSMPSMKIDGIDFEKIRLAFSVDIENPNDFEIPSPQLLYDLFVDSNKYNSGISVSAAPIAAAAATPLIIALELNYADLFKTISGLINKIEAPGHVALSGGFGIPALADEKIAQEISGMIPIIKPSSINFRGVSLRNLGLTSIDFEISWEIENNNNFAFNVNDLSYNFRLNNSQLSSGRVTGAPQIRANSKTVVPFVFSINTLSMVREIAEMVTRGTDVNYVCSGNISLGADISGLPPLQIPYNFSGSTKLTR